MKRFFAKSIRINFLLFLSVLLLSGCATYYYRQGNNMSDAYAYHMAIEQYQKALAKKEMLGAREKLAACYRLTNQYTKAEEQYAKIVTDSASLPEDKLFYSWILMRQGKYEDAKKWLDLYLKQAPSDTAAWVLRNSCDSVNAFTSDTSRYMSEPAKFGTTGGSAFAPAKFGDGIILAAENPDKKNRTYGWTGRSFLDIMTTKQDASGNWEALTPLKGDVNGQFHDGPAVVAPGDTVIYFTRNNYVKNKVGKDKVSRVVNLQIFRASKIDTAWTNVKALPFNSANYSCGHPALSADGKTMYFASDMPGGLGGTDIWKVTVNDSGCWCGTPVNLGAPINTKFNELFPSLLRDTVLYFSSEGHYTLGGMDIYKSTYSDGNWSRPKNMKTPVNSSADDFGIMVKDTSILYGYVSSNRASMDAGIDQVYFFSRILILNVVGIVVDSVTREPIEGAVVELTDKKTNAVIGTTTTGADGNFTFVLQPESDYTVRATKKKPEYFADSRDITTVGRDKSEDVFTRLRLLKKQKIFVLRNILYDLDKADIRPDAAKELDKLVEILKENPEITIELSSHCDIRGKYDYNMKLSQRRAESAVAYIISKGVEAARMTAKGYGWTKPYVVNEQETSALAKTGTELTPKFIKKVKKKKDQETLHQMNRRTEFKITSDDTK